MNLRCLVALLLVGFAADCRAKEIPPSSSFAAQVKAHFAAWDRNKDGVLSREEIDALVSNPKVTGAEAAAVAALKRAVRNTRRTLPPLTAATLAELAADKKRSENPDLSTMYSSALHRIEKTNRELFPTGQPSLASVQQGRLGDCFCLAPLGAMVFRDPQEVMKRITHGADGKYHVRFGGQTITVAPPTDAELALLSSSDSGLWVSVYEKAVGRLRQHQRDAAGTSFLDLLTKGGSAGTMVEEVTGHQIVRFACKQVRDAKTSRERQARLAEARGAAEVRLR